MKQEFFSREYDDPPNGFRSIDAYKIHPELLPFVGSNYNKATHKILLVGESHYSHIECKTVMDGMGQDHEKDVKDWYSGDLLSRIPKTNSLIVNPGSYNTRFVVGYKYIEGKEPSISYNMYRFPAKVIAEMNMVTQETLSDQETFTYMAFMNYYQRPAFHYKKSLELVDQDESIAAETFSRVYDLLRPEIVIFTSKKAFDSFRERNNAVAIHRIPHPCSRWWNRRTKDGKNGNDKLEYILMQYK